MPCECHSHSEQQTIRKILMEEHRVIERVLDAVERMVEEQAFDKAFLVASLDFFRNFADGCHHAKEEEQLFPELERAGVPRDGGPIGCMLDDHQLGRSLLRTVAENLDSAERGDPAAAQTVRQAAARYVNMLRLHIQKEDNVLFVIAENLLTADRKKLVLAGFDHAETGGGDPQKHQRYIELADRLSGWRFAASAFAR